MPSLLFLKYLPAVAAAGAAAAVGGAGYLIAQQAGAARAGPLWGPRPGAPDGEEELELLERPPPRATQLERLGGSSRDRPFDLLVIGGGATGSGVALDAVTRGLRTALVERGDFGCGTSSKSTKLVHGGVRYLEKAVFQADIRQLKLVFEALHERATMLALAPHLAHPLPILTPCYKWWEVPYYWAGLKAYDLVAGTRGLVLSKYLAPGEVLSHLPTLAREGEGGRSLKGGILYYDGQFDDARYNVALACTAAAAGAVVANYAEVKELIKNPDGKVVGAVVADRLGAQPPVEVYARVVMNTTGCFADQVRHMSQPAAPDIVQPSSGAHITLPGYYAGPGSMGIIIPKTKDGRIVFMLPWLGGVIAGTTDAPCPVAEQPLASPREVDFILETLSDYLGIQVRPQDVLSTWSGIRPLAVDPRAKDTQNTVRDHVILEEPDGMITVSGGKWTTYRLMAAEAVDTALATGRMPPATPCRTERLPLLGGSDYRPTLPAQLAQEYGPRSGAQVSIDPGVAAHLAASYGGRAGRVLQLAADRGLGGRLVGGQPLLEAEVVYCVRHEYCEAPEDFLARRSRLAFLDAEAALAALPRVVDLMAGELAWDAPTRAARAAAARDYLATYLPPAAAAAASRAAAASKAAAAAAGVRGAAPAG